MQSVEESVREEETRRMVTSVVDSLGGLHVLVIGPGLGRDPAVLDATAMIMERARDKRVGLVLDADALYLLSLEKYHYLFVGKNQDNDKVQSARGICVLTPNVVEYKRLLDSVAKGSEELFQKLLRPGIVMVRKGHHDVIESFDGDHSNQKEGSSTIMICEEKGGLKRSGGIGDILSGSIGTFVAWNRILQDKQVEHDVLLSCWMATCLTKRATRVAFEKRRRSMTAPDVLEEIGTVVDEVASSTIVEEDIHVNYSAQNKQF
jgi:ATP-dependent NAD(P)H-hydrate dehydratase